MSERVSIESHIRTMKIVCWVHACTLDFRAVRIPVGFSAHPGLSNPSNRPAHDLEVRVARECERGREGRSDRSVRHGRQRASFTLMDNDIRAALLFMLSWIARHASRAVDGLAFPCAANTTSLSGVRIRNRLYRLSTASASGRVALLARRFRDHRSSAAGSDRSPSGRDGPPGERRLAR